MQRADVRAAKHYRNICEFFRVVSGNPESRSLVIELKGGNPVKLRRHEAFFTVMGLSH